MVVLDVRIDGKSDAGQFGKGRVQQPNQTDQKLHDGNLDRKYLTFQSEPTQCG